MGAARHDQSTLSCASIEALRLAVLARIDNADVVSFDVFDTLVERRTQPPDQVKRLAARVFVDAARATLPTTNTRQVLELRDEVEGTLRRASASSGRDHECKLSDIARAMSVELVKRVSGTTSAAELERSLVEAELEAESRVVVAKPGTRELLRELTSRGKRVIAMSDMYLDGWMLARILDGLGFAFHPTQVYVSADQGVGKHSGRLFRYVFAKERVDPKRFLHVGDTLGADVTVPRSLGASAIHFVSPGHAERVERWRTHAWLAERNPFWCGEHLFASIPKATDGDFFFRYGHDVLGPIYATFVAGLREALIRDGVEKVFFVAREGDLFRRLYAIFEDSALGLRPAPASGYLFLSRKTVALPAVRSGLTSDQVRSLEASLNWSGVSILATFGLTEAERAALAQRIGFSGGKQGLLREKHDWRAALLGDAELQRLVRARAAEPHTILRAYLAQEGVLGAGRKVAIADIGWSGSIQRYLQDAFVRDPEWPDLSGYYLSYNDTQQHGLGEKAQGILFDYRRHAPDDSSFAQFEELFENGARALHGSTVGYRTLANGRIEPVLQSEDAPSRAAERAFDPMAGQLREGAVAFTRKFVARYALYGYTSDDLLPYVHEVARRAVFFPTHAEVEQVSKLVHAEDAGTSGVMDFSSYVASGPLALLRPYDMLLALRRSQWKYGTARSLGIPGLNQALQFALARKLEMSNRARKIPVSDVPKLPRARWWESAYVRAAQVGGPRAARIARRVFARRR